MRLTINLFSALLLSLFYIVCARAEGMNGTRNSRPAPFNCPDLDQQITIPRPDPFIFEAGKPLSISPQSTLLPSNPENNRPIRPVSYAGASHLVSAGYLNRLDPCDNPVSNWNRRAPVGPSPHRDDPGPDWIQYDDGRVRRAWIGMRNYWSRTRFTPTDPFVLIGVRFMPGNPGPNNSPCWVKVYRENQQNFDLQELVWETEIEQLRQWVDGGNNWHWVEIPEDERIGFAADEHFSIVVGPAPAVGDNPADPQEGDGWWMMADEATQEERSFFFEGGEQPSMNHRDWGEPYDADIMLRANGDYQVENRVLHVPRDFETIQEAIDNAIGGDTVLVADGIYRENINFSGKNIVVASHYILEGVEDFIFFTIIDGNDRGSVVTFPGNEDENARLIGFTIQNGSGNFEQEARFGGGILCQRSDPTLEHLFIRENDATQGGGIYCERSNPTIRNCTIINNVATFGGGLMCYLNSSPTVTGCTIDGNESDVGGGITLADRSDPTFTDCVITNNTGGERAGGVYLQDDSRPLFIGSNISNNSSNGNAGGIYCFDGCSPEIRNCTFTANEGDRGGAVHCRNGADPFILGCNFTANVGESGVGIYAENCSPTIDSCLFDENEGNFGGGIVCILQSNSEITNCVFTEAVVQETAGGIYIGQESNPTIDNCRFEGNRANLAGAIACFQSSDATIVDCEILDNHADLAGGIYAAGSDPTITTCVITENRAVQGGGGFVFNDQAQPILTECTITDNVSQDRGGGGYGQVAAIPVFNECVFTGNTAEGRGGAYYGLAAGAIMNNCILRRNSSEEYGGGLAFERGEPEITDCIINVNESLFGGGVFLQTSDAVLTRCTIDSNHAVDAAGGIFLYSAENAQIINCMVNLNTAGERGGGILGQDTESIITGCTVIGNRSADGAGVYLQTGSTANFTSCRIEENVAEDATAGVYVWGSDATFSECTIVDNEAGRVIGGILISECAVVFRECEISGNVSRSAGGVFIQSEATPTIEHCYIRENIADYGGGFYITLDSEPVIDYCLIVDNAARMTGGAVYHRLSSPQFINCTIASNDAAAVGGIFGMENSNPTLLNTIVWGNDDDEIHFYREEEENSLLVEFSDIQGGEDDIDDNDNCEITWGEGNIDEDPEFVDFRDGDYHLQEDSPCIDAGDPDSPEDPDGTDADMGSLYYHQGPGLAYEPERFDFGTLEIGEEAEQFLILRSVGDERLTIFEITIDSEHFEVDFEDEFDIVPGREEEISIVFAPQARGEFLEELIILSDDPFNEEVIIDLLGVGFSFNPPEVANPIEDQVLEEDFEEFVVADLNVVFIDQDNDELEFTVESDNDNLIADLGGDDLLWLEVESNWHGHATIWLTADDGIEAPRRDDVVEDVFEVTVTPVNDRSTEFELLTPENFTRNGDYPEVMFTWQESFDPVEDSTLTYSLNLAFGDIDIVYRDIETTFYTVLRDTMSLNPNESTDVLWFVHAHDGVDSVRSMRSFIVTLEPLSVARSRGLLPTEVALRAAFPNPFNNGAVIPYEIPARSKVQLMLYDQQSRLVNTLVNREMQPGYYRSYWNGLDYRGARVPAGLYIYVLQTPEGTLANRLVLLR